MTGHAARNNIIVPFCSSSYTSQSILPLAKTLTKCFQNYPSVEGFISKVKISTFGKAGEQGGQGAISGFLIKENPSLYSMLTQ